MTIVRYRLLFLLISLFGLNSYAQYFAGRNDWKKERQEIYIGGGVNNFLGDLGGRNQIGKDYSYVDMELSLTRPSGTFGYRYRLSPKWSWRTEFCYMQVKGDDKLTKETFRHNRNLHFKSNIFELNTNIEFTYVFGRHGNRYHIKNTFKRRYKAYTTMLYASVGVGGFYFNPKAKYGNKWVPLQPLGTEGQGLAGGPGRKYMRVSISIPMSIGYRIAIQKKWTIGIEYNFRKTFTDYIDDVSKTYYPDMAYYKQERGAMAAYLADPSLGEIPTATAPNADGTGAQRGDKQKDSFMAVELKIGYILKQKRKRRVTKAKF
jgi:hypothetical protein